DVIQYKLDFTTDDTSTTPVVQSVTFSSGGYSSGTYTSDNHTFSGTQDLLTFVADDNTPTHTSITYQYSVNGGATWRNIPSSSYTFPDNTIGDSFQWRADLSSTDSDVTPTVHSVTLTTSDHSASPPTKYLNVDNHEGGIPGDPDQVMDASGNVYVAS